MSFRIKIAGLATFFLLVGFVCSTWASQEPYGDDVLQQKFSVDSELNQEQVYQNEAQVRKTLAEYEQILVNEPDNHDVLQKAAYLHYRLGWLYLSGEEKKEHYLKFFDYIGRAKKIQPDEYYTSLLLAVAKAKIVGYLSSGDQVRMAREMTQDVQALMEQKGDDPDILYLLSWINFKIGQIPKVKKVLASAIFGGLPEGMSTAKAISLLENAIQLRPDYIVYQYDLGYYYMKTGNPRMARLQFEEVGSMQPRSSEGAIYKKRADGKIRELDKLLASPQEVARRNNEKDNHS